MLSAPSHHPLRRRHGRRRHGCGHSKVSIMDIIYIQDLAICSAKISIIWSGKYYGGDNVRIPPGADTILHINSSVLRTWTENAHIFT